MMKELLVISLFLLGQVADPAAETAKAEAADAVSDAASEAQNNDAVSEEAPATEAVAAADKDGKKKNKRDYSRIIGKKGQLDLLFLADLNGAIAPLSCEEGKKETSYANILGTIAAERGNSLVISAGSLLGPTPMARRFLERGADGAKELAELWGKAKFDYVLPGGYDFYLDPEIFKAYYSEIQAQKIPMFISNIKAKEGKYTGLRSEDGYSMVEQNGLQIDLLGIAADKLNSLADKANTEDFTIEKIDDAASELAAKAKDKGADLVIAVVDIDDGNSAPAKTIALARTVAYIDLVLAAG
jgi:2',3'-cyclic-nucleotide 2'-phosphodiesterase (5'-nucleotidase family)